MSSRTRVLDLPNVVIRFGDPGHEIARYAEESDPGWWPFHVTAKAR